MRKLRILFASTFVVIGAVLAGASPAAAEPNQNACLGQEIRTIAQGPTGPGIGNAIGAFQDVNGPGSVAAEFARFRELCRSAP